MRKLALFITRITLKQCENLSKEILCKQLEIDEFEANQLLDMLHDEHVIRYKYTFACPSCGELNTVEEGILEEYYCYNCCKKINIHEAIEGATVRYILDRSDFFEFLEETYKIKNVTENEKTLQKVVFQVINRTEDTMLEKEPRLFISHCTKDAEYIKAFVEFLEAMGMPENSIFCSSIEGYKIEWGADIYDYLASEFNNENKKLMVIFMLSKNYYKSPACLNEMGATWILKKDYRSILLPGFEYKKITGAIDPNKIAIKLDSNNLNTDLNDVKKQFELMFDFKAPVDAKWDRIRKNFIEAIQRAKTSEEQSKRKTSQRR